jgi:hypothetical protein
MGSLAVLSFLLALLFLILLLRSWSRIKNHKWISAGFYAVPASLAFIGLFSILLVLSNLSTYQRLTFERDIAELSITQLSNQVFEVSLDYRDRQLDKLPAKYIVNGDEWRLEARVLKWRGWANLLGLDSYYQLDRLSGRYLSVEQARSNLPSVHALSSEMRGLNLWQLKQAMKSSLPFIDAYYGQSVFLPLKGTAVYIISINQTGLIARPANQSAKQAVEAW